VSSTPVTANGSSAKLTNQKTRREPASGPDTIRYAWCSVGERVLLNAEGNPIVEPEARRVHGTSEANRTEGIWRLGLDESVDAEEMESGILEPGHCERRFSDADEPEETS
jgi:hypothetical protein